eukprot:scaffold66817_cov26-Tisochrysis_lutea.AAC.1
MPTGALPTAHWAQIAVSHPMRHGACTSGITAGMGKAGVCTWIWIMSLRSSSACRRDSNESGTIVPLASRAALLALRSSISPDSTL